MSSSTLGFGNEELNFGDAWARKGDPQTSHLAANKIRGAEASALQLKVLEAIASTGQMGATNHDIVELTGLSAWSTSPRVRPLVKLGLIADSGERRIDLSKSKRRCIVWKLTKYVAHE